MSAGNPLEAILLYLFSCLQYLRMQQEFLLFFHQLHESTVCFYDLLGKESLGVYKILPPPLWRTACSSWMCFHSKDWWEQVVFLEFTDEWKENFHMSWQAFVKLCQIMEDIMSPEDLCVPQYLCRCRSSLQISLVCMVIPRLRISVHVLKNNGYSLNRKVYIGPNFARGTEIWGEISYPLSNWMYWQDTHTCLGTQRWLPWFCQ